MSELNENLYCLHCRYNLRGLAGDPVRCPECGFLNRIDVGDPPASYAEKELEALRANVTFGFRTGLLALLALSAAIGSLPFGRNVGCTFAPCAGLFVLALIFFVLSTLGHRANCRGDPAWARRLLHAHLCSAARTVIIIAVCVVGLRLLSGFGDPGAGLPWTSALLLSFAVAALLIWRPLAWLAQRRARLLRKQLSEMAERQARERWRAEQSEGASPPKR